MTVIRFVPVGPGQAMALVAGVGVSFLVFVLLPIVSMWPTRSDGCLAAGGAEMALTAPDHQVMAGSTILLRLVSMVTRL